MSILSDRIRPLINQIEKDYPKLWIALGAMIDDLMLFSKNMTFDGITGQVSVADIPANQYGQYAAMQVVGFLTAKPVAAGWTCTANAVGAGAFVWDDEIFSTSTEHFKRVAEKILVYKEGWYLVGATVQISNIVANATASLYKNGVTRVQTLTGAEQYDGIFTATFCAICQMSQNDYFSITSNAGNRVGDANKTVTFFITRLN